MCPPSATEPVTAVTSTPWLLLTSVGRGDQPGMPRVLVSNPQLGGENAGGQALPAALSPTAHARPVSGLSGARSVTHLLPRLWLFLCLGTGGVGRLPATDASGQVGRRLNLAELEPAEGPVNKAERAVMGAAQPRGPRPSSGAGRLAQLSQTDEGHQAPWLSALETLPPRPQDS